MHELTILFRPARLPPPHPAMGTISGRTRLRFRNFEFEPNTGELYRDRRVVHLQEHPRQVLLALLERPGDVVTRDQLRERLWGADTFVDFEHGLNTAVKKARQALGDSAETPEFIETLARRGYRFIGQIDSEASANAESVAVDAPSDPPSTPAVTREVKGAPSGAPPPLCSWPPSPSGLRNSHRRGDRARRRALAVMPSES